MVQAELRRAIIGGRYTSTGEYLLDLGRFLETKRDALEAMRLNCLRNAPRCVFGASDGWSWTQMSDQATLRCYD